MLHVLCNNNSPLLWEKAKYIVSLAIRMSQFLVIP